MKNEHARRQVKIVSASIGKPGHAFAASFSVTFDPVEVGNIHRCNIHRCNIILKLDAPTISDFLRVCGVLQLEDAAGSVVNALDRGHWRVDGFESITGSWRVER
jgi:hypothetical protein